MNRRASVVLVRLVFAASLLGAAGGAGAEETASRAWKDVAELGFTNTTGNSRVATFEADNLFSYAWKRTGLELKGGALTSKEHGKTADEEYNASEKVTRELAGKLYGYERFGWDRNRFSGIRDRYNSFLGAGEELWSAPKDSLVGEAGAGYISEERPDKTDAFASGRLYVKCVHALSKTASVFQDAEYLYNFQDAADYRLNTETALLASISTNVALKASYKWKRVEKPAPGFIKDDTITTMALVVNY